ncbi:hypothetical protein [Neorhodopirellula pilleata]|uniref:Uncharacterized protein n=1 Tax=Neorhodopirellula pilleata TaxID=2714738 RepID=A0A5C6A6N9_9BACT|nr:hypothetical protein [Neorhodopirellula pilleata]TWT95060.1 hypothetical protein Pla100_36410 [Neorhodopirellula pilleata]
MTDTPDDSPQENSQPTDHPTGEDSPGCLPAVVAGTLLMLIVAFVLCGVTTWILFQKRTEIASRSLQGFIPNIEQSLLEPDDKARVIEQLETLINQMRDPNYDPAQAAAIMQRIVRLPIPHWGELDAVESFVRKELEGDEQQQAVKQLSRVRRAVEMNQATVFDIVDVLEPVAVIDETPIGRSLKTKLTRQDVDEVIVRAKRLADRAEITDQKFDRVDMADILAREIQTAKTEGGY